MSTKPKLVRSRVGWALLLVLAGYFFKKDHFFEEVSYATLLQSQNGDLLGAQIASDGQWRFPKSDSIPENYVHCLRLFEDEYFYYHPGVNPWSTLRALVQNLRAGRTVSGGSTISMQVVRLHLKEKERSILQKLKEMFLALRLELHYSKQEILAMHSSQAPFGGNVVGLEAACWRYFNRKPSDLSWAEYAVLAVLPNAPSLIHPGRNRDALLNKRNRLLLKLNENEFLTDEDYQLALLEPLPDKPHPLPNKAVHLLQHHVNNGKKGQRLTTTLNEDLQERCERILKRYVGKYRNNSIQDGAVLVADIETGAVKAYVGNVEIKGNRSPGYWNDMVMAERSTGSVLKPFLYACMMHEGQILPNSYVDDVPTFISGYAPKNYAQSYDGVVPAAQALARSLNVPAVRMLRSYSFQKFHGKLQKLGMKSLHHPPSHYGLSMILGGAEGRLWDLCGMYASLGRNLMHFEEDESRYRSNNTRSLHALSKVETDAPYQLMPQSEINAGAIWYMFKAMQEVHRPDETQSGWRNFVQSRKIAWKTGTSFGYRDAWAIGVDGKHVVGVWIGNADGTGREGLVGVKKAAPVLFEVFNALPDAEWFKKPQDDLDFQLLCHQSGFPKSIHCKEVDTVLVPISNLQILPCPYHKTVHLDASNGHQVHSGCESMSSINTQSWFALPPVQEYYFRKSHPWYRKLPPFRADCLSERQEQNPMSFIYPTDFSKVKIPLTLNGERGEVILKLAHRIPSTRVFWYLDGAFIEETQNYHELGVAPSIGPHQLTVVDEQGEHLTLRLEVLE